MTAKPAYDLESRIANMFRMNDRALSAGYITAVEHACEAEQLRLWADEARAEERAWNRGDSRLRRTQK